MSWTSKNRGVACTVKTLNHFQQTCAVSQEAETHRTRLQSMRQILDENQREQ